MSKDLIQTRCNQIEVHLFVIMKGPFLTTELKQ